MGANLSCVRLQERPTEADYQHFNLTAVPDEIFGLEKFLQVLLLDYNAIKDLPKALFNFTQLIRLGVSDNEIETLSCNIANLTFLEEFDISRNGIADIPDDIRNCKNLRRVDFSVNPIGRQGSSSGFGGSFSCRERFQLGDLDCRMDSLISPG
eukprot:m.21774 g.21774  ORF g.21774 m.21774 type:complete len:153 (+) comp28218_c1_seq3:109-567(+)